MKRKCFLILVVGIILNSGVAAAEGIVFSRNIDGYWQICTINPDGSGFRQITTTPYDKRDPVWLKTERAIVYRLNTGELFEVAPDTGKERRIVPVLEKVHNFDFSNETKKFVYANFDFKSIDTSNIWILEQTGGDLRLLTYDGVLKYHPRFSPDGKEIVFVRKNRGLKVHNLWLINSDGSGERQLTEESGRSFYPAFSPDGQEIIFSSNHEANDYEVYRLNRATSEIVPVVKSKGLDIQPRYSPDGQSIVFVSSRTGNQQLWITDADGQDLIQLTAGADESVDPSWIKE